MEIKVICGCGTKYKFDVVPVDGHMPQAVKCPSCGANGTPQANAAIREALGITPPEVPPATAPPLEVPPVSAAVAPPPVVRPSPLRVSLPPHAAAPAPMEPVHLGGIPAKGSPSMSPGADARAVWAGRGKKVLTLAWKGVLILLCIVAMLAGFGGKKGKRLRMVARLASAIMKSNSAEDEEDQPQNLWGQDIVLLLIKHTNETEIAETCADFWQDTYKKKISFVLTNDVAVEENQIGILPAHNGCVQIVGGLKWPIEDFEKLTQHISEKFNTVAIATRDVDFSGAYVFGVFDRGEKKFRAEMQIKGDKLEDSKESVSVEGQQWAREHGFKPGKEGFDEFHLGDGDAITRRLGFKLWDQEEWDKVLLLTEVTAPAPVRALPVRAAKSR